MDQIINHYDELRNKLSKNHNQPINLPTLKPCQLILNEGNQDSTIKTTQSELHEAIIAFQPLQGWLCCQSNIVSFTNGDLSFLNNAENGWVLYGELIDANNDSLHISPYANGKWKITRYHEQAGKELLSQSISYLGTEKSPGKLSYTVYWKHDVERGFQKQFSRFTGFELEEQS